MSEGKTKPIENLTAFLTDDDIKKLKEINPKLNNLMNDYIKSSVSLVKQEPSTPSVEQEEPSTPSVEQEEPSTSSVEQEPSQNGGVVGTFNQQTHLDMTTYYKSMQLNTFTTKELLQKSVVYFKNNQLNNDTDNNNNFIRLYYLLKNPEILFLCGSDITLLRRIININNFSSKQAFNKACWIIKSVIDMWKAGGYPNFDINISKLDDKYKKVKMTLNLYNEVKPSADEYVKSGALYTDLINGNVEVEISKSKLGNIMEPIDDIHQIDPESIKFGLQERFNPNFYSNSSVLPKKIKGGNMKVITDYLKTQEEGSNPEADKDYQQTRFLFNCILNNKPDQAKQCMNTLQISTFKLKSYDIIKTLPEPVLIKLATLLGIRFKDNMIQPYEDWILSIKKDYEGMVNNKGEVELSNGTNSEIYKKLCIIHYIGKMVIDTLASKSLKYSILRAQNKAPVQENIIITGPNVSYRTKGNYANIGNKSDLLTANSTSIATNSLLYVNQSDEQLENMRQLVTGGGNTPNAQLICSNVYEKLICQTINKYESKGYRINKDDLAYIDTLINNIRKAEIEVLDTYKAFTDVLKFDDIATSDADRKMLTAPQANYADIIKRKKELDEALKKRQELSFKARNLLDIIFPWKKDIQDQIDKSINTAADRIIDASRKNNIVP